MEYWEQDIEPHLTRDIEHIDMLSGTNKIELYQHAKALIFPVEREEPFGMTVIESMSCGTPVIAYNVGAIPEIITDGKTGYLVNFDPETETEYETKNNGFAGLHEAVKNLYALSSKDYLTMRKQSRKHVEDHFTVEKMVDGYEKVYKNILSVKGKA
jgi:glycosyltransferase involved in cell wall biosynthesis